MRRGRRAPQRVDHDPAAPSGACSPGAQVDCTQEAVHAAHVLDGSRRRISPSLNVPTSARPSSMSRYAVTSRARPDWRFPAKSFMVVLHDIEAVSSMSRCSTASEPGTRLEMVGAAGLEPANGGSKGRCLTIWRRPKIGAKAIAYRAIKPEAPPVSSKSLPAAVAYADAARCARLRTTRPQSRSLGELPAPRRRDAADGSLTIEDAVNRALRSRDIPVTQRAPRPNPAVSRGVDRPGDRGPFRCGLEIVGQ